jgi:hypothetical protein
LEVKEGGERRELFDERAPGEPVERQVERQMKGGKGETRKGMNEQAARPGVPVEAKAAREQGDERREKCPEIESGQVPDKDADEINAAIFTDRNRAEERETRERQADQRPRTEQDKIVRGRVRSMEILSHSEN